MSANTPQNKIYFITGNKGKVHEARYAIGETYFAGSMDTHMTEIQSDDYHEIIWAKAQSFIDDMQENWPFNPNGPTEIRAIVEDTGLECANMNGFPGPYIRYYFDKLGLTGICKFNGQSPATFVSHSAAVILRRFTNQDMQIIKYSQEIKVFEVRQEGRITIQPSGTQGFGFDPIFCPAGYYITTLAEMDIDEKQNCSARMQSIRQARDYLIHH